MKTATSPDWRNAPSKRCKSGPTPSSRSITIPRTTKICRPGRPTALPVPDRDRFSGYSVFCSKENWKASQSRTLAKQIGSLDARRRVQTGVAPNHEAIPGENRPFIDEATGVYEFTDLVVVKSAKLPSVLLECGVIVNRDEGSCPNPRNTRSGSEWPSPRP